MTARPIFHPRKRISELVRSVALTVLFLVGTAGLEAQIVIWDVNAKTASANNPLAASTLDLRLSAATLTLGSGVTASATASTFGASGFDKTSLASALSAGDYLSFTVTPASGSSFSLSSMTLLFGVATAVTNFNVALASSASGFNAGNELWSLSFNTASPAAQTIALASVSTLQNSAAAVEFRLYGWRDITGTTTFRIRDNSGGDLSISGTTSAIPEPAAYAALVGLAGLALVAWRKRRS